MNASVDGPTKLNPTISKFVWFTSTDVALKIGEAVCYNFDFIETGVAVTDADARRWNHVETPTTLNAQHFAGVAARAYSAKSGKQQIEIYVPGSVCEICLGVATGNTTVGIGILTFDVTATFKGQFRYAGIPGEGSAVPLQQTSTGSIQTCLARLQVGPPSGGVEVVPLVAGPGVLCTPMVGGSTLVTGGAIASGHNTLAVLDGTTDGIRKKFGVITAELTAYDIVITPATGSYIDAADTVIANITFTNTGTCLNKSVLLEWAGSWTVIGITRDEPKLA